MATLSQSMSALLTCLLVFSGTALRGQSSQRQLTPEPPTIVDYDAIPNTLAAAWEEVSIVVHGKVISSGPPSIRQAPQLVQRVAVVEAIEVFKGDSSAVKGQLRVGQFGGTKESNGRQINTAYAFDPLQPGEEVILLLVPTVTGDGGFIVAFGAAGVYRIAEDGQSVRVPQLAKHVDVASRRESMPLDELKGALRELRDKSSRKNK